jgi:hypothetical protein
MKPFLIILGVFLAIVLLLYFRFLLSRWNDVVQIYGSKKRNDLKPIYGFWSEFQRKRGGFPLSNKYLKIAVTHYGLYLQYDLPFEIITLHKPVMIPWEKIIITSTKKSQSKGFDEYLILNNGFELGYIFLQFPISDEIIEKAKELGANLIIRK